MTLHTLQASTTPLCPPAARIEGLHHTIFLRDVACGSEGSRTQWVLHLVRGCAPVAFVPLSAFFIDRRVHEHAEQQHYARAVGLFLDFLKSFPGGTAARALARFSRALEAGSIDRHGEDRHGVFWLHRSPAESRALVARLRYFADWLNGNPQHCASGIAPPSVVAERLIAVLRANAAERRSTSGHQARRLRRHAESRARRQHSRASEPMAGVSVDVPIERLLKEGFTNETRDAAGDLAILRDGLITLLVHAGGLRVSEALHLFVEDVMEDRRAPGSAFVRVYHPEAGAPPAGCDAGILDRTQYLKERFRLLPRNRRTDWFYAPWQPLMLTHPREKYARVHWFSPAWGSVFWEAFRCYRSLRACLALDHPYLFVGSDPASFGAPYTVDAYVAAYRRALETIGVPKTQALAAHPHQHRLAYATALINAGVAPRVIQHALHYADASKPWVVASIPSHYISQALAAADPGRMRDMASLRLTSLDRCAPWRTGCA